MKTFLCGLLSLSALAGASAATAYEALRVVGKERGDAVLDRVLEVRASKGAPVPRTWRVAVLDNKAPSGVREFDVQGTSISAERAPQPVGQAQPMNMGQLNLDSDGAHTVAEREAKKKGFAYDHVNYLLRSNGRSGAPVWELRLVDEQNGNTAVLTVGAETGKLLAASGFERGTAPVAKVVENRRRPPVAEEEQDLPPLDEEAMERIEERRRVEITRRDRDRDRDREEEEVDKPGNKLTRFFDRAGRKIGGAFQKFGDKVDRTFSGSPKPRRVERRPTPAPSPIRRDANGTEYYRPRD